MLRVNDIDIKKRYFTDKNNEPMTLYIEREIQQVNADGYVQLQCLPSDNGQFDIELSSDKSKITNYEIIDLNSGILKFDATLIGKEILVTYTAIGMIMYSADRIFTNSASDGSVLETLGDLIRKCEKIVGYVSTLGDAKFIIEQTQSNMDALKEIDLHMLIPEAKELQVAMENKIADSKTTYDKLLYADGKAKSTLEDISDWVKKHSDIIGLDNRVDNIEKITINALDLGVKGDGTDEDISLINSIFNNIENKTIIFPHNKTYKINSTININATDCEILFKGEIIADCDVINLDNVNSCKIEINKIRTNKTYNPWYDYNNGKNLIDYNSFRWSAIKFNNVRNCTINISKIHGYKNGLYFIPTTYGESKIESGTQYNTINFGYIEACTYPIHFLRGANNTWINSNYFNGGELTGSCGVWFESGLFKGDIYNQNVFSNIGLEYCKNGGFLLEEGKENLFENFRMDKVDNFYIKTSGETCANTFRTDYTHYIEGCAIYGTDNDLIFPTSKYENPTEIVAKRIYYNNNKNIKETFDVDELSFNDTVGYTFKDGDVLSDSYKYIKDNKGNFRAISPFNDVVNVNYQNVYLDITNMHKTLYVNHNENVNLILDDDVVKILNGHCFDIITSSTFNEKSINFIKLSGVSYIKSFTPESNSYYRCIYLDDISEMIVVKLGTKYN